MMEDNKKEINQKIDDLSKLVATETVKSDSQVAKFVMKSLTELKEFVFKKDRRQAVVQKPTPKPQPKKATKTTEGQKKLQS